MSSQGEISRKRGRSRELKVRDVLRAEGNVCHRLAEGCADLVALREGCRPRLVQVKSTSRPFERFGPQARHALRLEAATAGADPELAWWPKNGALRFISADDWPQVGIATVLI